MSRDPNRRVTTRRHAMTRRRAPKSRDQSRRVQSLRRNALLNLNGLRTHSASAASLHAPRAHAITTSD